MACKMRVDPYRFPSTLEHKGKGEVSNVLENPKRRSGNDPIGLVAGSGQPPSTPPNPLLLFADSLIRPFTIRHSQINLLRRKRQVAEANVRRVVDGVGDDRRRLHHHVLADAARPPRPILQRRLDVIAVNLLRHVRRVQDAIIDQIGVERPPCSSKRSASKAELIPCTAPPSIWVMIRSGLTALPTS